MFLSKYLINNVIFALNNRFSCMSEATLHLTVTEVGLEKQTGRHMCSVRYSAASDLPAVTTFIQPPDSKRQQHIIPLLLQGILMIAVSALLAGAFSIYLSHSMELFIHIRKVINMNCVYDFFNVLGQFMLFLTWIHDNK